MSLLDEKDVQFMSRALYLAEKAGVDAAPNPMVGAVIVHSDRIIGEGYHERCGEAHAEVNAVNRVVDKKLLSESTIYVTLEPCSHFGKTPPCADMIVKYGFKRVVVACQDSFSEVSGRGIQRMRAHGIQVDVGLCENEARKLNKRFFTYHERKRPYVVLKWAQTKDGFVDRLPEHRLQGVNWITGALTKQFVHQLRGKEQAILVGVNTVINDNPSLTVREVSGRNPHRIILDPHGRSLIHAKVFDGEAPTTIFVKLGVPVDLPAHIKVVELKDYAIHSILKTLYDLGILSVFVEGGTKTLNTFIEAGLWDEAYILEGNVTFGTGIPAPQIEGRIVESRTIGEDQLKIYKKT